MEELHRQRMCQASPCTSPVAKAQTYADQAVPLDSLFWDVSLSDVITYELKV